MRFRQFLALPIMAAGLSTGPGPVAPGTSVQDPVLIAAGARPGASAPLSSGSEAASKVARRADFPLTSEYSAHASPFALRVAYGEESVTIRRTVFAIPLRPGATLRFSSPDGPITAIQTWSGEPSSTTLTAPSEPGIYGTEVHGPGGAIHLNLLVLHLTDATSGKSLLGYEIGKYRRRPANRGREYEPPAGFIAVSQADRDVLVSPHVTLGDLLCKQPGEPRLVHFTPNLIRKLEAVLEEVNRQGIQAPRLTLMSSFRTPAYNAAIGNRTTLSRHLWGDAADIFIDTDANGAMDDLDGDGQSTISDARFLAGIIGALMAEPPTGVRPGGLASYRSNSAHGPFVHVDARGQRARW